MSWTWRKEWPTLRGGFGVHMSCVPQSLTMQTQHRRAEWWGVGKSEAHSVLLGALQKLGGLLRFLILVFPSAFLLLSSQGFLCLLLLDRMGKEEIHILQSHP